MLNPRLAARYAQSLLDISLEKSVTELVYNDMLYIDALCKQSKDASLLLKSPVVKADTKWKAMEMILKGNISELSLSFLKLIISKGREFFMPEIAETFITLFKKHNSINDVVLTTAAPLDDTMKANIQSKIAEQFAGMTIDLKTKIDDKLIGGFVLEANNNVFDASILRDLNDIRKQFLKNEYIPDIR